MPLPCKLGLATLVNTSVTVGSIFFNDCLGCQGRIMVMAMLFQRDDHETAMRLWLPMVVSFEDGRAAYQRRDFETAIRLWRPIADQGNDRAQYGLGVMYHLGNGVAQDYWSSALHRRPSSETGKHRFASNCVVGPGGLEPSTRPL
jgi:hypothetical protein